MENLEFCSCLIASADAVNSRLNNDIPLPLGLLEALDLKVALGPNSLDIFSNAPAACATLMLTLLFSLFISDAFEVKFKVEFDDDLAFERDEVVDNNKGEVIPCKPGAKCVGVDEG